MDLGEFFATQVEVLMLWIGLTGGIASGKSTVSGILRSRGFDVIDADGLARAAVQNGTEALKEIAQIFGPEAIGADGELNRKKIGELVFSDRDKLDRLEKIIHPHVRALADRHRQQLKDQGRVMAFYDVPLLFEKRMEPLFDQIVVVFAPPATQLNRLVQRDGLSLREAERRIAAQLPIESKVKRGHFVIENTASREALETAVDLCLAKLAKLQP